MGLFSKFNVKAVRQAYQDLVAFRFLSVISERCLEHKIYNQTNTPMIDIGEICNLSAEQLSILFQIEAKDHADQLDLVNLNSHLQFVSTSIMNQLIDKYGNTAESIELFEHLGDPRSIALEKIHIAHSKDYYHMTDYKLLAIISICQAGIDMSAHSILNSASQSSIHDDNKSHTTSPPFTKSSSNASSQPKTFLSNVSDGVLQCIGCKKLLNVPHGKKFKLSCPKCKLSWIHDGTKWR